MDAIIQPPIDEDIAQLYNTTRWVEAYIPIPHKSGAGNGGATGCYVASLCAQQGVDNTDLFEQALAAAARRGSAPYFICMDANCDFPNTELYEQMLLNDWHNAAEGSTDQHALTYGRDPAWDRVSQEPQTSRIDYILTNASGWSMIQSFEILRGLTNPQHLGLALKLEARRFYDHMIRWQRPKPLPHLTANLPLEERQALAQS